MKNKQTSIVDYLKSQGQGSSFNDRKTLAKQYGIKNYRGTSKQNTILLEESQGGVQPNTQTLSDTELKDLQNAIKIHGIDKVTAELKSKGLFNELIGKLQNLQTKNTSSETKNIVSDITGKLGVTLGSNINTNLDTNIKGGQVANIISNNPAINPQNPNGESGNIPIKGDNRNYNPVIPKIQKSPSILSEEKANEEAKGIVQPYYTQQNNRITQDYTNNLSTINRLIQYTDTTVANKLLQSNTTFARAMNKATNNFTARNIVGSGIVKADANSAVEQLNQSNANANYYAKRSKITQEGRKANIQTRYTRAQQDLGQQQSFYTDLFSKQLQEGMAKNKMQDYIASNKRMFNGNNTEANSLNFNITTNTTPKNKVITGAQANKKSFNTNIR